MKRMPNLARLFIILGAAAALHSLTLAQNKQPSNGSTYTDPSAWEHRISGKVISAKGSLFQVETREQKRVDMDATEAIKSHRIYGYSSGTFVTVYGAYDAKGVLHAQSIQRAKRLPSAWPADR